VFQRVAVCCSVVPSIAECGSVLQCVAVCCSVFQRVAACCSVLQWVEVALETMCMHIDAHASFVGAALAACWCD